MAREPTIPAPGRLYLLATLTGAVIMALEILSSRILAPHFGNSVYVWGSIISVFLAALSVGYYWGGTLADRRPDLSVLGRLILGAVLCQFFLLLYGSRLAAWFGVVTSNSPSGTLLAATVLFGPPSLFLATVSPFAIRLATRQLSHLGNTAGRLFALSTAGSLFGTLLCTFVLIPHLELKQILSLLLIASTLAVGLTWQRHRADAVNLGAAAALLLIAASGVLQPAFEAGPTLYTRMTPYQTLEVVEGDGIRYLRSDRVVQSAVHTDDFETALPYIRFAAAVFLLDPEPDRMLVLGMGGGTIDRYLRRARPALVTDYVDIDPSIPEIARRFFAFADSSQARVHVSDGRRFLATTKGEVWDFIYCDTYIGLSVPFHLTTAEFFDQVQSHLSPGGVFGVNLAGGVEAPFVRAILRTVSEAFSATYVFQVIGSPNLLVLASSGGNAMPQSRMLELAAELDGRWEFEPSLSRIAQRRIEVAIDPAADLLLHDEFAPADYLVHLGEGLPEAAADWR